MAISLASFGGAAENVPNIYSYDCDKLDRLRSTVSSGIYMSDVLTYDVMGNINTLNRDNTGANQYNYAGNRLGSVNGVTGAYAYDANGNATTDGRNGMTLTYNYLNLPVSANKADTSLIYTYNAAGQKPTKNYNGGLRNYINGIEYNGSVIDIIHTEEGVAQNNSGVYSYEYTLTDHLGNNIATFYKNPNSQVLEVLQRDDYFAFGLKEARLQLPMIINISTTRRNCRMSLGSMTMELGFMIQLLVDGM